MRKLLLLLLITVSLNTMAGRESDGENGYWVEGDTFSPPTILIGGTYVSLLKLRRVSLNSGYFVCSEDSNLEGLEVTNMFTIRGGGVLDDENEMFLFETEHFIFLGSVDKRIFSKDCAMPNTGGTYMDASEFWQEMENNAAMIDERIALLNESLGNYKQTFIKSLGYNGNYNVGTVRYAVHTAFESVREDLGLYASFSNIDHLFMKNAQLTPEINQILENIDLTLIDEHKDGFLDKSNNTRESFIRDYYFHQNEITALRKKLKRYLPGDTNRIAICDQINVLYETYHYGSNNCDL